MKQKKTDDPKAFFSVLESRHKETLAEAEGDEPESLFDPCTQIMVNEESGDAYVVLADDFKKKNALFRADTLQIISTFFEAAYWDARKDMDHDLNKMRSKSKKKTKQIKLKKG